MSWGGSVQGMIASLKHNARPKRTKIFDSKSRLPKMGPTHDGGDKDYVKSRKFRRRLDRYKNHQNRRLLLTLAISLLLVIPILTVFVLWFQKAFKIFFRL